MEFCSILLGSLDGKGSLGENRYMHMYDWVPSLFTWNYHSIVNWLYPITKLIVKKKKKEKKAQPPSQKEITCRCSDVKSNFYWYKDYTYIYNLAVHVREYMTLTYLDYGYDFYFFSSVQSLSRVWLFATPYFSLFVFSSMMRYHWDKRKTF